jgi:hypothetical protein
MKKRFLTVQRGDRNPDVPDGSINYDELALIDFQILNATDAIIICAPPANLHHDRRRACALYPIRRGSHSRRLP